MKHERGTALETLFKLSHSQGMKLGLSPILQLDELFGFPSQSFSTIHIAGTNGKGSTTLKIARSLQTPGRKIGLYTSPHISTLRERIEINGVKIPEEELHSLLEEIFKIVDQNKMRVTFFEVLTLLSFLYFRKMHVDIAVVEVGMGGRLDATNIITPLLSVITSIGLDHTLYLGKHLEEIAIEKAGIIKENVPVLLGPQASNKKILHKLAAKKNSPCFVIKGDFVDYEQENRAVAKRALELLPFQTFSWDGLESTPACRFEIIERNQTTIVLDVGHNPDAFQALFVRLERQFPNRKYAFLVAFSSDKEIDKMLDLLVKKASFLYLTQASHSRALPPSVVAHYLKEKGYHDFIVEEDIKKALKKGLEAQILIVTGTFYIMKDVREALGIDEDKDLMTPSF